MFLQLLQGELAGLRAARADDAWGREQRSLAVGLGEGHQVILHCHRLSSVGISYTTQRGVNHNDSAAFV